MTVTDNRRPTSSATDNDPTGILLVLQGMWEIIRLFAAGTAAIAGVLLAGLRVTLLGRYRHVAAPFWVAGIAALSTLGDCAWYWLVAALAVDATTWRVQPKPRFLSARERRITAVTFAVVALALTVGAGLGAMWLAGIVACVPLAGGIPWWKWRGARSALPEILERWEKEVVAQDPRFAGEWVDPALPTTDPRRSGAHTFDVENATGVLELSNAKASEVAKLDAHAEWLMKAHAGTVTIVDDPRLTRRCVRVAFTRPGDGGRLQFWEGPTLTEHGKFTALYAKGGVPLYGRLWMPDGASHIAIVAPTGSGKGSIQRLIALESALDPHTFVVGVDGKMGKGLGYLKRGFGLWAKTPDEWIAAIRWFIEEMERRSADGGEEDSFVLRPGRPRIRLMVDDLPEVLRKYPRVGYMLQAASSQGRSLGMGICTAKQKGDGPSYGSTNTRSNILDGGWMWAGPASDAQAKIVMLQSFPFDPNSLPPGKGWAAIMGKHLGDQAVMPGRTLWIPNRNDVAEFGFESPFGTVEDWLEARAITPELDDAAAESLERAKAGVSASTSLNPLAPAAADIPVATTAPIESLPGLTPAASADAWPKIKAVLEAHREAATAAGVPEDEQGLLRGEVADEAGVTPRWASELLRKSPEVVQASNKKWRLAS